MAIRKKAISGHDPFAHRLIRRCIDAVHIDEFNPWHRIRRSTQPGIIDAYHDSIPPEKTPEWINAGKDGKKTGIMILVPRLGSGKLGNDLLFVKRFPDKVNEAVPILLS